MAPFNDLENLYNQQVALGTMTPYQGSVSYLGALPYDSRFNPAVRMHLYEPVKPQYDFQYDKPIYILKHGEFKLMPKGFDWVSGTIIKSISKGGGKKVRKMPRIFRFALLLALVWIVWDFVINLNPIVIFITTHLIAHK